MGLLKPAFRESWKLAWNPAWGGDLTPGASLAFSALTFNAATYEMEGVSVGTGDLTTTHTSDIYGKDHEVVYRSFAANEPVWSGGRVVTNIARNSNDLTALGWADSLSGTGLAPVVTANAGTDPKGGNTASRVILDLDGGTTSSDISQRRNTSGNDGDAVHSVWLKSYDTNTYTVQIIIQSGGSLAVTVTPTWQRVSVSGTQAAELKYGIRLRGATGTSDYADILVWGFQVEEANGRSNLDSPSENVTTGDNFVTKTFANENGNTVASNVVTEAVGTPLAEMPYLDSNPAFTQSQIQSNDLTNVEWTATTMTVAQDAVGIDGGATTACTLTATAGNATVIGNAITAASDTHAAKWYLKRKTGTGTIELTVDGGTTWQAVTIDSSFGGYPIDQAAVTNPATGIRIVTSGDAVIVGNAEVYL